MQPPPPRPPPPPLRALTGTGSYLAHPDGHTLKIWLESPEIGFPIKPDNYHCSEPKVGPAPVPRWCWLLPRV